jgi:cysteine-rich repeat protein
MMVRKVMMAVAAALFVTVGIESAASAATSLLVPQSTAFGALGHSCGGIQEQAFATGFDATSGDPVGDVYVQTRCGGSGRGGGYHVTTYSAWLGVTWDFTGAVVSSAVLATAPTVDPTFSAFDSFGNQVYNQLNAVNVTPANCTVGNTTYCSYRAYLSLASTFVPPPRVTSMSVASGPATGGTSVVVTGTGFTGATEVAFGGTPAASFTVDGDTSITAVSPAASAGTVDVTVTTAGGTSAASASDQFTFIGAPTVSGISPNSGTVDGGTAVTITGANFTDAIAVDFGEDAAAFAVNDDSSITALSPAAEAPDTVHVTVVTAGGTSPTSPADRFTYTTSTTSVCGDGTIDPGEQCDDGAANGPGDCCTTTCQLEAAGAACSDDGDLCTLDACDGAGTCTHAIAPTPTCLTPTVPAGASLLLQAMPGHNRAQFKWGKGPVVPLTDFGNPTSETMALCVYDQTGPNTYAGALQGSPSVTGAGAWTGSATGWRFVSTSGAPDGITGVTLRAGALPLRAKVQVKAKANPALSLPLQQSPRVVAQLKTSLGTCWSATFSTPKLNSATEFKAKSD